MQIFLVDNPIGNVFRDTSKTMSLFVSPTMRLVRVKMDAEQCGISTLHLTGGHTKNGLFFVIMADHLVVFHISSLNR